MRRNEIAPPVPPPAESPYWRERTDAFLAVIAPEMRIRYVSENCEKIIGFTPNEVVGRISVAFMHPDEVVDNVNFHQGLLRGTAKEKVIRIQRKDGSFVTLSIQFIPVKESREVKEIRAICQALPPKSKD